VFPLYFQMPSIGENVWFHPVVVYVTASLLTVVPFSEWSVRLPSLALGTLNVALLYGLARRIFGRAREAWLAAILLALTPAHFIHSRIAMDYLYPVPFVLGWLTALSHYLERRRSWMLFAATSLLGLGVYSYIASVVMMPVYLVLTLTMLWRTSNLSVPTAVIAATGFAWPLIPIPMWLAYHPSVVTDTLSRYRIGATPTRFSAVAGRLSMYWYFWDPVYLFLTGGYANVVNSTRHAGVFALPAIVPVAAGIRRLVTGTSSALGGLVLAGFFSAPFAACLAVPEPYAIDRELALLPFGILIAVFGFLQLWGSRRAVWRAVGTVALALVPLHFAFFYYDYFTDYRRHSAIWFELNHREALETIADIAARSTGSVTPPIYLPIDKDPYMDAYWHFTLAKLGREDLHHRTVLYRSTALAFAALPEHSLVLMRRGAAAVDELVKSGRLRTVRVIPEIADPPEFVVLER
jgi:4-amino-4-deoxy-L-arabinose transferase-like glycosyltransferase